MKFMKRSLTLMLAGLMAVSMVACGDKGGDANTSKDTSVTTGDDGRELVGNTYKTGLPIVKDPVTLEVLFNQAATDYSDDINEKPLFTDYVKAEDTNITIDWRCNQSGGIDEALALALATEKTMPDMVIAWAGDTTIDKNIKNLVDLTDMLEEWAPNLYTKTEELLDGGVSNFAQADGHTYTLPTGVWAEPANSAQAVTFINHTWLANVGMEMPTTMEELETVLQAFKDKDANGNGDTTDEIPWLVCQANAQAKLQGMGGAWGIAGNSNQPSSSYYRVVDGTFESLLDSQNYRDFLIYANRLCSNGLINADGFTIDQGAHNSLKASDCFGLSSGWYEDPENWTPVPVLTAAGYEGQERKGGQLGLRTAAMNGFMIIRACENPEAALRWWDEWHKDTETKLTSRDGAPGENGTWILNADGSATVNTPKEFATGISNVTEHNTTFGFRSLSALILPGENSVPLEGSGTSDAARYEYLDMYKDYFYDEFLPLYKVDADQTEIRGNYNLEINEYMDTFVANAVVSGTGLDDAGWQAHIDTLYNDLDLQGWIDWNQTYVDGGFKPE